MEELRINIAMTILAAIFTGGVLLIFIESQQVFVRIHERYNAIMSPFFKSFTHYVRFVSSISYAFSFKIDPDAGYMQDIKLLVDKIAKLGSRSVFSGSYYTIFSFTAKELDRICAGINNIWYFVDKSWYDFHANSGFNKNYLSYPQGILDEVNRVSPKYNYTEINEDMLAEVSGDFYTEQYQPISELPPYYEKCLKKEKHFRWLSFATILLTLLSMLVILFVPNSLNCCIISAMCIICCSMLLCQLIFLTKMEDGSKLMV